MREKLTGNSRGFGFVTFVDSAAVDQVLSSEIEIEGRKVDCKAAVPKDSVGAVRSCPPYSVLPCHPITNTHLTPQSTYFLLYLV